VEKSKPADEDLRGLVHRLGVEPRLQSPGAAAGNRQRRAAVDDSIEIVPGQGAAPGVDVLSRALGGENRDRMRKKMRVDSRIRRLTAQE
jgi:hypothetical protein